jgi:two-component system, chemotaxis family, protein-glutamate methylesterase/glutaminase
MEDKAKRRLPPPLSGSAFDAVALAASAGGLTAISRILSALPVDFPAAIVIVQRLDPRHRSLMANILSRRAPLQVKQAEEGDSLSPATVCIAPQSTFAGQPGWHSFPVSIGTGSFRAPFGRSAV